MISEPLALNQTERLRINLIFVKQKDISEDHMLVTNKKSLLDQLALHGKNIRAFGVKRLCLFGSFANDKVRMDSDVDFLVDFEPGEKTYDNFIGLSFYLEELSGRKVELITRQSLSKYIGPHILKQAEDVAI